MGNTRLWYSQAAEVWEEALPVGNGRLGAMVFGGVKRERIQLNEDSIWYGGPKDRNNPHALENLEKIRQLIFEGRIREAERLISLAFSGLPEGQSVYQTLGDLFLEFSYRGGEPRDYRRELDLNDGIVKVAYRLGSVNYGREVFCSAVDQVLVVHLFSDQAGQLSFKLNLNRGKWMDGVFPPDSRSLLLKGHCGGKNGSIFRCLVQAVNQGGEVSTIGDNLIVKGADSVSLYLASETSFRHQDPQAACSEVIQNALEKGFRSVREAHILDYQALFERVKLNLRGKESVSLPTDERLERFRAGAEDNSLSSLYFQYGRYLLISSSRKGSLPSNLQGIWNKDMQPPWDSKYTININTEMNYWPAESCNLPECHLPLFELLERMRVNGRRTARKMYNCRGFVAHHNTDIWADTAPQDIWLPSTYWPLGAAWLSLHLWEHYRFGQDREFLKRAYPTMQEAASFFLDFLVEDPQSGCLVTCPTVSPENTYLLPDGERGALCSGAAMDSQIIRALFSACIAASEILQIDESLRLEFEAVLRRLPDLKIGKHGQIQEWEHDYEEAEIGHRHISHLFALHPGEQISWDKTPQLAAAARKTLERRIKHGGGHTGWSRAWIINFWARLNDGEQAYENLVQLLKESSYDNLFSKHPPFQIDGNFGATAGISEMLLQSQGDVISLLPALPRAWESGSVQGLRARGGFEIDLNWEGRRLKKAKIKAAGGDLKKLTTSKIEGKIQVYCEAEKLELIERKTIIEVRPQHNLTNYVIESRSAPDRI